MAVHADNAAVIPTVSDLVLCHLPQPGSELLDRFALADSVVGAVHCCGDDVTDIVLLELTSPVGSHLPNEAVKKSGKQQRLNHPVRLAPRSCGLRLCEKRMVPVDGLLLAIRHSGPSL